MSRGDGTTTRQMIKAPKEAVFIWVNGNTGYARKLANSIDRNDLQIATPYWLETDQYQGRQISAIVIDHAAILTDKQWEGWDRAQRSVEP